MDKFIVDQIKTISLSMFRKNFLGVFHGSISAKIDNSKMIINKADTIFDEVEEDTLTQVYFKKDYRWNDASVDIDIHKAIYDGIHEAKYIAYVFPTYTMAYSLSHDKVVPKDYFGATKLGEIEVYDPKNYDDWYDRADTGISRYMKKNKKEIMLIKGYGVYVYDRDINKLAQKIAILEESCTILSLIQESYRDFS